MVQEEVLDVLEGMHPSSSSDAGGPSGQQDARSLQPVVIALKVTRGAHLPKHSLSPCSSTCCFWRPSALAMLSPSSARVWRRP